jgi:polysaccharide export outer membrane protein
MGARLLSPLRLLSLLATLGALLLPAAAWAQGEYRINRGDVLRIEVIEDDSLNRTVLVAPSGQITVPLAGPVTVAGQSLSAVQAALRQQLAPNFNEPPTVFVSLERPFEPRLEFPGEAPAAATVSIFVLGEIGSAGRLELEPGTTLLQALAQAGGPTPFAATKRLQLRRRDPRTGGERIYTINYDAILEGRSPNGGTVMAEGDVIVAPTRRLFE